MRVTADEMQRAIEFLINNQANFEEQNAESNRRCDTRFEETNRQITQTNQVVEALADIQAVFAQTVIGYVASQNDLNTSVQKQISDLTKAVDNFLRFSTGNGNSPPE